MLKRIGAIALVLVLCMSFCFTAFAQTKPEEFKGTLTIWSFSDELQNMSKHFAKAYPNVKINSVIIPLANAAYINRVNQTLRTATKGAPDVFTGEIGDMRMFIEAGYYEDLSVAPYSVDGKVGDLLAYTVDLARDAKGHIRALSWQATPGGLFYRRSLAKEYFGTDDPVKIGALWANWDGFMKMARTIKEKSAGKVKIVTDYGDLQQFPKSLRKSKWVVDGKLVLEQCMIDFMDTAKTLRAEDLVAKVGAWSGPWSSGMADKSIFAYVLPTWGLHYVLKPNAEPSVYDGSGKKKSATAKSAGDWALTSGPGAYYWGGTWLGVNKKSPVKAIAWEFVKFCTLNKDFLETWAKETGDFLANAAVVAKIGPTFSEEFLGGQNHYLFWMEAAKKINGGTVGPYDSQIDGAWGDQQTLYVDGKKTKEVAIADFKKKVKSLIPKVTVD